MSKFLCNRLWQYYLYDLTADRLKACCKGTKPLQSKDFESDWRHITEARQLMLKGERPKYCQTCWDLEDKGLKSFREVPRDTDNFSTIENEETFDRPSTLEIILAKTCDLKCIYCGSHSSTRWQQALNLPVEHFELTPEIYDHFKKRIDPWWDSLWLINFIGGEPLLQSSFYRVLEHLLSRTGSQTKTFRILSNFNANAINMSRFLQMLAVYPEHRFVVAVSNEASGKLSSKIREGLNFERFDHNVNLLLQETSNNVRIYFSPTLNSVGLEGLPDFLNYVIEKIITFRRAIYLNWNIVTDPVELSPLKDPEMIKKVIPLCEAQMDRVIRHPKVGLRLKKNWAAYKSNLSNCLVKKVAYEIPLDPKDEASNIL